MLSLFARFRKEVKLSPQEACEIARRAYVLRKRTFPNHGRYVPPTYEDLVVFLEKRTEFINYWIGWSEDKRCSPAWFFQKVESGFEVGRTTEDGKISECRLFQSPVEACADFILKELNEERAEPAVTARRLDGVRFEFEVASSAWLTSDRSAKKE